jgi:hypothetical protein
MYVCMGGGMRVCVCVRACMRVCVQASMGDGHERLFAPAPACLSDKDDR